MIPAAERSSWQTRWGFYLVAIGSAVGLGNLWRFPFVVAENGGGAFVLLFMFLAFLVGAPLLVSELIIGKTTRQSGVQAFRTLTRPEFVHRRGGPFDGLVRHTGWLMVAVTIVILSYYAVISGWVLHFVVQYAVSLFQQGSVPETVLETLKQQGSLQVGLASVHLIFVGIVVARDVEQGLERFVAYVMPAFVGILVLLAYKAWSFEDTEDAIKFFLYPDFTKLHASSLGAAVGQLFFTLSIGFGSLITFGSYLSDKTNVPLAGFRVVTLDSSISLFAGLLIFPLIFLSLSTLQGPDLLFRAIPRLLEQIPGGTLFGLGFFLCLYLASLGASVGLFETVVANLRDSLTWRRRRAVWTTSLLCLFLALFPALSSSYLASVSIFGEGILKTFDYVLVNWLLPTAALAVSLVVGHKLAPEVIEAEFKEASGQDQGNLFVHYRFILRFIVPSVILVALGLQLVDLLF